MASGHPGLVKDQPVGDHVHVGSQRGELPDRLQESVYVATERYIHRLGERVLISLPVSPLYNYIIIWRCMYYTSKSSREDE